MSYLEKYNTTLGFYEPAIFHLHTIGRGKLKEMYQWSIQQKSTFVHEYIHFLQDVTTIQGLNNMFIKGEYIRYITKMIKAAPHNDIHVPINPFSMGNNVDQNWKARAATMGTTEPVVKAISFSKIHITNLTDNISGRKIPVEGILVECINRNLVKENVLLGTLQMLEGMAKLIQDSIYPTRLRHSPYNPYYIAQDVADMIIPNLSSKPSTMIALFVLALQRVNPGCDFVDYLQAKAKNKFNADTLTPDIIYEELKRTTMNFNQLGVLNYEESHKAFAEGAKEVISEYLGGVWYWQNINKWFQSIVNRGYELKLNSPFVFQNLAAGGDIISNKVFLSLLENFGTPIVTNNAHDYEFIRPNRVSVSKRELINVYAMMQVHQVFLSNGIFKCPLRKYCQNEPCGIRKQKVDKRCLTHPWERMRKWNRCYFTTWWYFKGFKDVKITV